MVKNELITHKDPKSPISEIFRTLRTNIQFMNIDGRQKTVLVTSTLPGEGKSWLSSNLAATFAQADKKTLLIDADMRKGSQYSIFGVSPIPGLSNYLSGMGTKNEEEKDKELIDYIQETDLENLFLITAGNVPPNPSELLSSQKMIDLLEELKSIFDVIIIDGTPCQLVTDSLILTTIVDTTVLVAAHKQTKKEELKRVIKNIKNVGGKIAGVVVNKMPLSAKKYEQRYYYGSTTLTEVKTPKKSKIFGNEKIEFEEENNVVNLDNLDNLDDIDDIDKEVLTTEENDKESNEVNEEVLENNLNVQPQEEQQSTFDKTNDIIKQINQYLEEEQQKLSANSINPLNTKINNNIEQENNNDNNENIEDNQNYGSYNNYKL